MSEETKEQKKPPKEPQEPNIKDLVVSFEGLDKLDDAERSVINDTFKSMQEAMKQQQEQINALTTTIQTQQQQQEAEKKQMILDRLEEAGYKLDPFKDLDLKALQASTEALAQTDKEFVVPIKREKPELPKSHEPLIYNPQTKKMEPFHKQATTEE